jgi:uncharacterized protein (DUF934 family)
MAFIIKDRRLAADNWQLLRAAADGGAPQIALVGDIIVPLGLWLEHRDALLFRTGGSACGSKPTKIPR